MQGLQPVHTVAQPTTGQDGPRDYVQPGDPGGLLLSLKKNVHADHRRGHPVQDSSQSHEPGAAPYFEDADDQLVQMVWTSKDHHLRPGILPHESRLNIRRNPSGTAKGTAASQKTATGLVEKHVDLTKLVMLKTKAELERQVAKVDYGDIAWKPPWRRTLNLGGYTPHMCVTGALPFPFYDVDSVGLQSVHGTTDQMAISVYEKALRLRQQRSPQPRRASWSHDWCGLDARDLLEKRSQASPKWSSTAKAWMTSAGEDLLRSLRLGTATRSGETIPHSSSGPTALPWSFLR